MPPKWESLRSEHGSWAWKRREVIAASPRRTEVIEGRQFTVIELPPGGEEWVTFGGYPWSTNGNSHPTGTASETEATGDGLLAGGSGEREGVG